MFGLWYELPAFGDILSNIFCLLLIFIHLFLILNLYKE